MNNPLAPNRILESARKKNKETKKCDRFKLKSITSYILLRIYFPPN